MAGRPILALVSLVLLAAGILFEFFIVLSGGVRGTPINKTYFLSVNTDGIANAPSSPRVAWTYYALATQGEGATSDTTGYLSKHPAFPFQPRAPSNFDLSGDDLNTIPPAFRTGNYYYYMSRFAWVFYLIALFFAVIALFTGLLALCSRIGGYLSGLTTSIALFFMTLAAALMTAWTVRARDEFNSFNPNANASLGRYALGFSWGAFAAYLLATVLFCVSGAVGGRKETTYKEKKSFFRRSKSTRSRDGVKSEYS